MSNITEIAKKANVSRTTVSRVLNNHPYVKEEKREAVLQAIKELEYVPNLNAINLSRGRTNVFGVIVPKINHPFFSSLIEGIGEECHKHNYNLLVFQSNNDASKELEFFDMLKYKLIDGLILGSCVLPTTIVDEMSHFGKIVSCEYAETNDLTRVFVNHEVGMRLSVDHLREKGHQKIGLCIGNPRSGVGISRAKSFFQLQQDYGLTWRDEWYFTEKYTIDDGFDVIKKVLAQSERPTAFVVGSDQVAAGMLYELKKQGIEVPDQLAIVGFDNHPISKLADLTTIHQPIREVGQKAVTLLHGLVQENSVPLISSLDLRLIERNST
ncbi:LacI family DNA-binding transcriptional regulator [Bacillus sp. NTK071]|uniref:LacI family DNA-binding transcriptional regulator n=1 Tax=Bacillus sp. NTK071 TaxID=2802175 RepID=UPI001A8C8819|nr:LacI family DNA-binding transcriptional regulator [Bacillus sp. NTK071]MBN8211108.1 LacI family DNA-binding transcriptional regulator [Bacillus sp. NTK071]